MPRKRNPVGIAVGKLIVAIRKEQDASPESAGTQQVLNRAHTLLQASQTASVPSLLDGRSLREYLDADWLQVHPLVELSVAALEHELRVNENTSDV
jgi:hypothetical protein